MSQYGIARVVVLCGAVALACGVVRSDSDDFLERIDRAVVEGSVAKLQAARSVLVREAGVDSGEATSGDLYTLSYIDWRIAQLLGDDSKKEKKQLLKEAQKQLDTVLEREPGNAEAHALKGGVIGLRINGAMGGMFLGPKAKKATQRAFELDPDNPRVALQRGIGFMFTPKSFGGGLEPAEAELLRAQKLFQGEPADKPWPNWGRVDVLAWLGQVLVKTGRNEEARKLYNEALELEPDYNWVRRDLIPALDAEP